MNVFRVGHCPCKEVFPRIALRFLDGLYNFCTFVIIFSLLLVTMICRRVTYFTDLEMIEYYQKTCSCNSKSKKTKNYLRNYSRYTTLKNNFLLFTLGHMTVMRISK